MAYDWRLFLTFAETIAKEDVSSGDAETIRRNIVSRAYYAAFNHAKAFAVARKSFTPSGYGSDHSAVRRIFQRSKPFQLADLLQTLLRWRELCDYADEVDNLDTMAATAVEKSRRAITLIDLHWKNE